MPRSRPGTLGLGRRSSPWWGIPCLHSHRLHPTALTIFAAQDAGFLVAEWEGAGGGFQDVGEGHKVLRANVWLLHLVYLNYSPSCYHLSQWRALRSHVNHSCASLVAGLGSYPGRTRHPL